MEKLHIYGFGKHEDLQIDITSGLNVFYGENEAGKSSIQQFILHILFGFPQKNAQLLRYEPKSGAKYGGKVQLLDEHMGRVIVERVKGKASGDVTLYFENGQRGGEKELASLLHSYSRADFEAIFSFSLLQLQGFEKMTEDELTRTLLSSGTTGMDTLSNVEAKFIKEMGELFKPSGKKPVINQKIEEIRATEAEWRLHLEEVDKFEPSITRLKAIDSLFTEIDEQEKKIQSELERYMQWKQLKPIKEKQLQLEHELKKVGHQTFPTDGIRRLESIKDKEINITVATEQLNENLKALTNNNDIMTLEQLEDVQAFLAYETEWHQLKAKQAQIADEQERTLQGQMQQLALVGIDWERNLKQVIEADVSIQQEEKLVSLLKRREQVENELLQEKRLCQMKTEDLHKQQMRIQEVKKGSSSSTFRKSNTKGASLLFCCAIFLLGLLLGFLLSNWVIALFSLIVSAGVYFMQQKMRQSDNGNSYVEVLVKEEQTLKQQIEQLNNAINNFEREQQLIEQKIQTFLASYQLSPRLSPALLQEVFNRLRMIQEQQIQLEQMENKLSEVRERLHELFSEAKSIAKISLMEDMLFHQLREHYLIEKKKIEEHESMHQKMKEMSAQLKENRSILSAYTQKIQALFDEAKVSTENEFYEVYTLFEKRISLEKEYEQLQMQLGNKEIEVNDFEESFESESRKKLQDIQRHRNELVEEKASLRYKTNTLLEDEQQSKILQHLEQKKAELYEYTKKWAAYKVVVEAIKQMLIQLREERLPEVLENAQYYFKMLTNNSYEQLLLTPEGIFEVVQSNGQRFHISELSQATKEQAYISLRISLAVSLKKKAPFPIIMDDPFVHFDRFRLQQMVQLMEELQKEHQLLYFTCHENMQEVWQDVNVIQVATLLAGSGGIVK